MKRKAITILLLICMGASLLAGCDSIQRKTIVPTEEPTQTGTTSTTTETEPVSDLEADDRIFSESGTELVHYEIELPQFEGSSDAVAAINKYYNSEYANFITTAQEELKQIAENNLQDHEDLGTEYHSCEAAEAYEIERQDENILSISRRITMRFGGETVETYYKGDTFDLSTGDQLRLQDIFSISSEEYLPFLTDNIKNQISTEKEEGASLYFEDAEDRVETYLLEDDFYLTDYYLIVFFPEGTLGEYGVFNFLISYEELDGMLSEKIEK